MTKRISIVVTYDTESEKFVVDSDATEVHFPEGLCWDDETEYWVDEPDLVEDVVQRLAVQLSSPAPRTGLGAREPMAISTKFIELALNILDPDFKWDAEEMLDFSDSGRQYLDEHPIVDIEHDGQLINMVQSFVGEWQDVNPLLTESAYHPNTDAELEVLGTGIDAETPVCRAIE